MGDGDALMAQYGDGTPAPYMFCHHSFYAWHREKQYGHLTDAKDRANTEWAR